MDSTFLWPASIRSLPKTELSPLFGCGGDIIRNDIIGSFREIESKWITCEIATGRHQYTAIDDCTRYQVLALFPRRNAESTLEFLEKAIEEMPFPIQRIQTDRGGEFFAQKVQKRLLEYQIKFCPIKPASPHLNGKSERAQETVLNEFYATADMKSSELVDQLQEWQHFYNWHRPYGILNGKSPIDRFF